MSDQGFARGFYKSRKWIMCKNAYIKSVGGLCERCSKKGWIRVGTEVHHIVRLTQNNINDPSIALNWDNLELLCFDCHHAEHGMQKRYDVGFDGQIIIR